MIPKPRPWFLKFTLLLVLFLLIPFSAKSLPAPPALAELCKNSDTIVKGKYVGGMVGEVKDCRFWVTFQIKPDQFFKKPSGLEDLKILQFKKQYFVDSKECATLPGPNADPQSMAAELKKPKDVKKVFFLKKSGEGFHELNNVFWSIVDWQEAPGEWHKEFKNTPACHGN